MVKNMGVLSKKHYTIAAQWVTLKLSELEELEELIVADSIIGIFVISIGVNSKKQHSFSRFFSEKTA